MFIYLEHNGLQDKRGGRNHSEGLLSLCQPVNEILEWVVKVCGHHKSLLQFHLYINTHIFNYIPLLCLGWGTCLKTVYNLSQSVILLLIYTVWLGVIYIKPRPQNIWHLTVLHSTNPRLNDTRESKKTTNMNRQSRQHIHAVSIIFFIW